jgi:hypothetical protein
MTLCYTVSYHTIPYFYNAKIRTKEDSVSK